MKKAMLLVICSLVVLVIGVVAVAYVVMEIAALIALVLHVLEIHSVFDRLFPSMKTGGWAIVVLVFGVGVPFAAKISASLFNIIVSARDAKATSDVEQSGAEWGRVA